MPRHARLRLAGLPLHIIQRGNNRTACFFTDEDYALYLHVGEIRSTANGGYALGNERFNAQIAAMLERRVEPGAPGRPRKENSELSEPQTRAG